MNILALESLAEASLAEASLGSAVFFHRVNCRCTYFNQCSTC